MISFRSEPFWVRLSNDELRVRLLHPLARCYWPEEVTAEMLDIPINQIIRSRDSGAGRKLITDLLGDD